MNRDGATRYWCARCQYPGKEPFIFGSVCLPITARFDEITNALADAWARISPHDPPKMQPLAGIVIFQGEDAL